MVPLPTFIFHPEAAHLLRGEGGPAISDSLFRPWKTPEAQHHPNELSLALLVTQFHWPASRLIRRPCAGHVHVCVSLGVRAGAARTDEKQASLTETAPH